MSALVNLEEESQLLAALERAYGASPFWRSRLQALGVKQGDFVHGFPFGTLPLLTKKDILEDQREAPPYGRLLSVPADQIRRIHKTSGTTGQPFFITLTDKDIDDTNLVARRAFRAAGMKPGEPIIHCLNFNMWSGGVTDYSAIEAAGATGIPFGVGNSTALLRTIKTLGVQSISATPSYMYVLRDRCREVLGIEPAELGLRRGYFGGEGLLQIPRVREEIETAFNMVAIDANYGMSEVLSVIAGEDETRDGLVYHGHGVLYAELIDEHAKPVAIEPGVTGELVFSSLRREGQPLFRYRTNDVVKVLACGRDEDDLLRMRFSVLGRSDDMLVFRGVNFFPQSLITVLAGFEGTVSRFYRVLRPQPGAAAIQVYVEALTRDPARLQETAQRLQRDIAASHHIRCTIQWVPENYWPRDENKQRWLIDQPPETAELPV